MTARDKRFQGLVGATPKHEAYRLVGWREAAHPHGHPVAADIAVVLYGDRIPITRPRA